MFSILFSEERNAQIFSDEVIEDLELNRMFDDAALKILSSKCTVSEMRSRTNFFKRMEDRQFKNALDTLYLTLKSYASIKNSLEKSQNKIQYYFVFLKLAQEYMNLVYEIEFLLHEDNELLCDVQKHINKAMASLEDIKSFTTKYNEMIEKNRTFVLDPYSKVTTPLIEGVTLPDRLCFIASQMGLKENEKHNFRSESLPEFIDENVIFSNASDRQQLKTLIDEISIVFDNEFISLIPQLEFYFKIFDLKHKAQKFNIKTCFPVISQQPMFSVAEMYDVSLLGKIDGEIVPNDIEFTRTKNFYVLTGANSGGKTSFLKAIGVNLILFLAGCPIFCESAEIYPFSQIITHFCSFEKNQKNGAFFDEVKNIERKVDNALKLSPAFFLLNEPFTTTNSKKAEETIYSFAYKLFENSCFGLLITHFHRIANGNISALHVAVDRNDGNTRKYKIEYGSEQSSYAMDILKKYRLDNKTLGVE